MATATYKNKWKRRAIYNVRALCMMVSGFFLEWGTSCFVDYVSTLSSIVGLIVHPIIWLVVIAIYVLIASKMRPYKHRDNDLPFIGLFLFMVLTSFMDNYAYNIFQPWWKSASLWGSNIVTGVICLIIALGAVLVDTKIIDGLYEKYDKDKIPFFLVKAYNDKIEKQKADKTATLDSVFFTKEVFCVRKKRVAGVSIAIVILMLAVAVCITILICFGVV